MQPFRYHVFACDQRKPDGMPCCHSSKASAVIDALRKEVASRGLLDEVQITVAGSLGLCARGPNWVVYPEGIWYSGITPADVPEIVSEHFQKGQPVVRLMNTEVALVKAEIADNRNRMQAALKARDSAGVLPDDFSELVRGYQPSRIVLSAIELDLFTAVAALGENATAAGVAEAVACDAHGIEILLNALAALNLLLKQDGLYANTPLAARHLCAGATDDARQALKHNLNLWTSWSTLTARVKTGRVAAYQEMNSRDDDWTVPFIAAMHRNAASRAPVVVRAVGTQGVRRLLDVGGGSGAYSIAFAQQSAELSADIFDLASVVPIARAHVSEAGLSDRIFARTGDLRKDAFGTDYDLVLLSAICHMLGPDENQNLFLRAFNALASGGRVTIQDHVMSDDGTAPRAGALFAINMLVGTPRGGTFSKSQYEQWLLTAGFSKVEHVALPGPNDLVIGYKG
jgi:(2Fe-2S) ferredoxin/2-polyprenyl-3-methyl-5-hydroxy-6-metoxy-1,4-benzoquinol methylase